MARKKPKRITPTYLQRLAGWYLERYDAPRAHVRRVLMQRVHRAARFYDDQEVDEGAELVDALLERLVASGLVDDHRYATNQVRARRGRGQSERKIRAALRAKGCEGPVIDDALAEVREEAEGDPEREAAIRYARRRRFGPWRRPDSPDDKRIKELASMARAGFPYDLSKRILDADDAEALEDELPFR